MKETSLQKFLVEAKKKSYASLFSIPRIYLDGSKEYRYKEKGFVYKDRYFGSTLYVGHELVFHNKKLIWSMVYRGGMVEGYQEFSDKCFSFLKKCLRKIPEDFPVRGPKLVEENSFRYENNWKGNLEDFVGEEKIFFKNKQIYFRNYHGGSGKLRKRQLLNIL